MKLSQIPHEDFILEEIEFGERFRKEYNDIPKLKVTILEVGLIQPMSVTLNPEGSEYPVKLATGGRRYTAIKELISEGKVENKITCRVFPEMSALQLRSVELIENAQRSDMTFYEDAQLKAELTRLEQAIHGIQLVKGGPGHTMADTAKILNVSPSQIQSDSKLLGKMEALKATGIDWSKFQTRSDVTKVINQVEKQAKRTVGAAAAKEIIGTSEDERLVTLSNAYRIDDCTLGMKAIASGTQDFIEIDPPYAIDLHRQKRDMGKNYDSYNEIPVDKYIPLMRAVFDEAYRIMKPNSWMICWFAPEPWAEVIRYLIEGGTSDSALSLYLNLTNANTPGTQNIKPFQPKYGPAKLKTHRMCGIWAKDRGQTNQPMTRFGNSYEMFYYIRKGNPEFNRPGQGNLFDYAGVNPQKKVHPTERPADMIADLLDIFVPAGSCVTVPFAGSGRTLLEAAKLDMIPIGFDLSQAFKDSYIIQLNKEVGK